MKRWAQVLAGGFASLFATGIALAQHESTSTSQTTAQTATQVTTQWYGQWWVWAIGIAVFLIVVIALTSRGKARG